MRGDSSARGQANLVALAVAVVVLTAALGVGLAIADGAFGDAERDATERATAASLAETLVHPDSSLSARHNVLNASAVAQFESWDLDNRHTALEGHDVTVRLDDETLATTGDTTAGTTIRRIVLVEERQSATRTPGLSGTGNPAVTLPRRTDRVVLTLDPDDDTTVSTVRIDERVELHNDSGLAGEHEIAVSPLETATLGIEANGELSEGDVRIEYFPVRTRSAVLEVTVDA